MIENPKNMPKDPPIDPINPESVITSISSMICLVLDVVLTMKTPEAERFWPYTGDSSKSGR